MNESDFSLSYRYCFYAESAEHLDREQPIDQQVNIFFADQFVLAERRHRRHGILFSRIPNVGAKIFAVRITRCHRYQWRCNIAAWREAFRPGVHHGLVTGQTVAASTGYSPCVSVLIVLLPRLLHPKHFFAQHCRRPVNGDELVSILL